MPSQSILYSSSVPRLNHSVEALRKMFALLPIATISRYKMTFIFLMCASTQMMCTSRYHLFILSNDHIVGDNAVANNSSLSTMKLNLKKGNNRGRAAARDNNIQQQSFFTTNCCAEGLGSPGKVCCR